MRTEGFQRAFRSFRNRNRRGFLPLVSVEKAGMFSREAGYACLSLWKPSVLSWLNLLQAMKANRSYLFESAQKQDAFVNRKKASGAWEDRMLENLGNDIPKHA